jgi:WD40 repeat protein
VLGSWVLRWRWRAAAANYRADRGMPRVRPRSEGGAQRAGVGEAPPAEEALAAELAAAGIAGARSAADGVAAAFAAAPPELAAGHAARVFDLAFHPRDPDLLASASDDNSVRVWRRRARRGARGGGGDARGGDHAAPSLYSYMLVAEYGGHGDSAMRVNFSPAGDLLASGAADGEVHLWRLAADAPGGTARVAALRGHPEEVYACAFVAGGRRILAASADSLFLWDVETAALLQTVEQPALPPGAGGAAGGAPLPERWAAAAVFGIATHEGSDVVAGACSDGALRLWGLEAGGAAVRPLAALPWAPGLASDVALGGPGGCLLGAVAQDGAAAVLDLRGRPQYLAHVDLGAPLLSCTFVPAASSPSGGASPCLAASGADGSVHFVDADAGGAAATLRPPRLSPRPLLAAEVSACGRRLAAAGDWVQLDEDEVAPARRPPEARWAPVHVWSRPFEG